VGFVISKPSALDERR